MRTPIIAGNWKLNKTNSETIEFLKYLKPAVNDIHNVEIIVCPPFTSLAVAKTQLVDSNIHLGSQNIYWEPVGNFTGEISALMIEELCSYVIIGHSERRSLFGETDDDVNKKVKIALENNLIPIICIGERLEEKEAGLASAVISRQVRKALSGLKSISGDQIIIAYEPVWAIGSGKTAAPDEINIMIRNVIRPTAAGLIGSEESMKMRVLYGGSVNEENINAFISEEEIDGALIGGASLIHEIFSKIIQLTNESIVN